VKWKPIRQGYRDRLEALRQLPPHELLEVSEQPTEHELKTAYRAKVKAYHPDRLDPFLRAQSQEVLKVINTAYEALRKSCKP
jgi:DnaJ-class molecular chaperone